MEQFLYYVFYYKITHILGNIEITAIFYKMVLISDTSLPYFYIAVTPSTTF